LNNELRNGLIAAAVGAITGGGISLWLQNKSLNETTALAAVQTRIAACHSIAENHHRWAGDDKILEVEVKTGDTTSLLWTSTNAERRDASINMARALTLCLAKYHRADEVMTCVSVTTTDSAGNFDRYVRVVDPKSDAPPLEGQTRKGAFNPAC